MNVLIAGCGYVGTALGIRLSQDGDRVWGLKRRPEGLPREIRPIRADLSDPRTLGELPTNLDCIVYAVSADAAEPEAYRRTYVEALKRLQYAIVRGGSPDGRLVFVSSTAVYGEGDGGLVDEDTPCEPSGFRGETLLDGEATARRWDGPCSVVRASGIYGPGRSRLIRKAEEGDTGLDRDRWTNRIHRDDLAGAIAHVLRRSEPEPVYLASDREPVLLSEVLAWIASRLVRSETTQNVVEGRSRVRGAGKRCLGRRLAEEGFRWRYPSYREGYGELLTAYRGDG